MTIFLKKKKKNYFVLTGRSQKDPSFTQVLESIWEMSAAHIHYVSMGCSSECVL